jgi:5-methylcytosine-specific restriction endonuclease McrA
MTGVIVLNASYEPLGVVSLHKAMKNIIRGRVEVVRAHDSDVIHTSSGVLAVPIAVRFTKMVRVPYRNGEMQPHLKKVLIRDNYTCAYCGKHAKTVDHIQPKSRGGKNTWMNLIAACQPCNGKKANKTPEEAHMVLQFQPHPVYQQDVLTANIAKTGFSMDTLFDF